MSNDSFVHLHCHSHYSLLDGAASIDHLVERAKSHGMNALAITDHGNLHGALEFYRKAKAAEINPIIGYEAYIAPGSRRNKNVNAGEESSYHLTLLATESHRFSKSHQDGILRLIWRVSIANHASTRSCWRSTRRHHLPQRLRRRANSAVSCSRIKVRRLLGTRPWRSPSGFTSCLVTATSLKSRTTVSRSSGWPWKAPSRSPGDLGCRSSPPAIVTTSIRKTPKPKM